MTQDQIREIVKMTIDELDQRHLLKDQYQSILRTVDKSLYSFFDGAKDADVRSALRRLSDDPYIDIIFLQYRDKRTIEFIAAYYDKDTSTIKRNKKRLIKCIYETLRDM